MSKVVHLSDTAHQVAKNHCRDRGLRMSDWVAELILIATQNVSSGGEDHPSNPPVHPRSTFSAAQGQQFDETHARHLKGVEKKARLRLEGENNPEDATAAVYAAPPFWARS